MSFEKLHVLCLGIIRQFCEFTHSFICNSCFLPLPRVIASINDLYSDFHSLALVSTNGPFRTTLDEIKVVISFKIRGQSAPFLWVCIMGIADSEHDSDVLL